MATYLETGPLWNVPSATSRPPTRKSNAHSPGSIASLEFDQIDEGTRFTHVEHGVLFDQFRADGPNRETGSRGLLDALGNHLA